MTSFSIAALGGHTKHHGNASHDTMTPSKTPEPCTGLPPVLPHCPPGLGRGWGPDDLGVLNQRLELDFPRKHTHKTIIGSSLLQVSCHQDPGLSCFLTCPFPAGEKANLLKNPTSLQRLWLLHSETSS